MSGNICDTCVNNIYDEDEDDYFCQAEMDEDEAAAFFSASEKSCPFYRKDDEYEVVRHQM